MQAAYYEYTDDQGISTLTNKVSEIPPQYRDKATLLPMEEDKRYPEPTAADKALRAAQRAVSDAQQSAARPKPRAESPRRTTDKSVDLYVTSWCPYCKQMREFLDSLRARYTVYDIEEDSEAADRFRAFGGRGVPLVVVDGHAYAGGISQKELARILRS